MDTARDEEKSYYDLKFELEEARKRRGSRRLEDMAEDAKRGNKRPPGDIDHRPYVPMQVDAAKIGRLSDEERQKLRDEGKCFGCESTKHMYAKCPRNPKRKGKGKDKCKDQRTRTRPRARVVGTSATIEEEQSEEEEEEANKEEAPPAYMKKKELMAAIKKMSTEEREDLLDAAALDSDQDF
jgi:hypothetical protein